MDDLLLYFDCGTSLLSVQQESDRILGLHKQVPLLHGGNILVKSL